MEILPKDVISFSVETYSNRIGVRTRLIYNVVLTVVFLSLFSLPFIYIDINISGQGIIRPKLQRTEIYAPVSGQIDNLFVEENQEISKGQTILSVYPDILLQKEKHTIDQIQYKSDQLSDVNKLLELETYSGQRAITFDFNSTYYRTEFTKYKELLFEINLKIEAEQKKFKRQQVLYEQKVISTSEFEDYENNLNTILAEKKLKMQNQYSKWESEKRQFSEELKNLKASLKELKKEKERYVVKSPIEGNIMNILKVQKGSYISANQLIGEISPNDEIIAECYISPSDIGLMHVGQLVRFKVDAFNYNEWGFLEGQIFDISKDVNFGSDGGQAFFIVKCKLEKQWLDLQSGYKGYIKKGMTVQGRIFVNRRNVFQLLFDKADDWINPSN